MFDSFEKNIHALALNMIRQTGDKTVLEQIRRCVGGNNKSWMISTEENNYFLKHYFFSKEDNRDRLGVEASFAEFASNSGINNIPELLVVDRENLLGLFQFIEGEKPNSKDMSLSLNYVNQALSFIKKLNDWNKNSGYNSLSSASDACLSIKEHLVSLEKRFLSFQEIPLIDPVALKAKRFIEDSLSPEWERLRPVIEGKALKWGMDTEQRLNSTERIVSPSDFGFHNSILSGEKLYFIDFEYAGWDDPAKMTCDFFCQPEIPVSLDYYEYVVNELSLMLIDKEKPNTFVNRVKLIFPLYRLKWCCIMLNDFVVASRQRKYFAFSGQDRRQEQLDKTISYYTAFDFKNWY